MPTREDERLFGPAIWLVVLIGAFLRLVGLYWDQGYLFNPDEGNIGRAAAALSFPNNWVPEFSAYNGLALYLPRLFAELIEPVTRVAADSPWGIVLAGRVLSALYATATIPVLAALARRHWGAESALFVAVLAAFTPALIQSAHFATTESALVLCLSILLLATARHMQGQLQVAHYGVWVGVILGIGFGFKTTALTFAVVPIVAVSWTTLLPWRLSPAVGAGLVAIAIMACLALVTTPQLWATPSAYLGTMRFEAGVVAGSQEVFWTYQFTDAIPGLFELSQWPWILGLAIPVAAALGMARLLVGFLRGWKDEVVLMAPAAMFGLVYAAVTFGWFAKFIRYQYPLVPTLILLTGHFVASDVTGKIRRPIMVLAALGTALAGMSQASIYLRQDPRIEAWDWLAPRLAAGETVLIEPVDVGPTYWKPPQGVKLAALPYLESAGEKKAEQLIGQLVEGDWLMVASRRHHAVLPRLKDQFPLMCQYYEALWGQRLGYEVVGRFLRRPALLGDLLPEVWAEETLTVFDSPEVFVLRNAAGLNAAEILSAFQSGPVCDAGDLPRPPR